MYTGDLRNTTTFVNNNLFCHTSPQITINNVNILLTRVQRIIFWQLSHFSSLVIYPDASGMCPKYRILACLQIVPSWLISKIVPLWLCIQNCSFIALYPKLFLHGSYPKFSFMVCIQNVPSWLVSKMSIVGMSPKYRTLPCTQSNAFIS